MLRIKILCLGFFFVLTTGATPVRPLQKPRLVVLISIDQFRSDYLTRFEDLFLPPKSGNSVGGFRYLMERGAYYPNAHHDHLPLATGPGHSVLFTGAPPYKSGIVGNEWWDYKLGRSVYCVEDERNPQVGTDAKTIGISPDKLLVTTVGDELKMATGGKAKVFGLALKDRAAVLMAGHLADGAYWFNDDTGRWVTSRFYRRDATLPEWVEGINAQKIPHGYLGKSWTLTVPASALDRLWTRPGQYVDDRNGIGTTFPHSVSAGQSVTNALYFRAFSNTPFANEYVFTTARKLISEEGLGQDEIPDILAINLSSNDYIGHSFGPDSAEVLDVTVQTDRMLSRFVNHLAKAVPGGLANVTFVVTADHGAPPNGQAMREAGIRGGIWTETEAIKAAEDALAERYGFGPFVHGYREPYLYLNRDTLKRKNIPRDSAESVAAAALTEKVEGIYAAYTRTDALAGRLPRTDIGDRAARSFHPDVSGDILIVSRPGYMPRNTPNGIQHAEPYAYDTHVPLLMAGFGIRPGVFTERVSTLDIAPTLSFLLHVQLPSGCEGHILSRAMVADGTSGK